MVAPSGEGAARCMKLAMQGLDGKGVGKVDYINPHATATPVGDLKEIEAIRAVFGDKCPPLSATKSLTGHSLGAAGVQEAIYCLLMMQGDFIAASANIETLDDAAQSLSIVRQRVDNAGLARVMSNSFDVTLAICKRLPPSGASRPISTNTNCCRANPFDCQMARMSEMIHTTMRA